MLFALAIQPLVEQLQSIGGLQLNLWYLDDGVLGGPVPAVLEAIALLEKELPSYGLSLHYEKCEVIGDLSLLVQFPSVFKQGHPDDATYLEVPVGSPEAAKRYFRSRLLCELGASQYAFFLLRTCIAFARPVYWTRTIPTEHIIATGLAAGHLPTSGRRNTRDRHTKPYSAAQTTRLRCRQGLPPAPPRK